MTPVTTLTEAREVVRRWSAEERALLRTAIDAEAMAEAIASVAPVMADPSDDGNLLLKVDEAAQRMRCGTGRVYELIHAGALPAVRRGRLMFLMASDVDEFVLREAGRAPVRLPSRRGRAS